MSTQCSFCDGPVNPYDLGTYKQVSVWVKAKSGNGATLSVDTGAHAHAACVIKAKQGIDPNMDALPGMSELELKPNKKEE